MDIKTAVIEAIRAVVLPELDAIRQKITAIEARLDGIDKRFEDMRTDMNQRFGDMRTDMHQHSQDMRTDMHQHSEDMRADMNKRFEDHFNFNMKRFDSIESQINNILAEIRELRGLYQSKPDMEQFRALENRYIELSREVTLLKQKIA